MVPGSTLRWHVPSPDAQGAVSVLIALPLNTQLVGTTSFVQFGVADPKANAGGLSTSDAMELVFR